MSLTPRVGFADHPLGTRFAALIVPIFSSFGWFEQSITIENGSVQNYRMNLACIGYVYSRVGIKNQQVRPSPRFQQTEFMPSKLFGVVARGGGQGFQVH